MTIKDFFRSKDEFAIHCGTEEKAQKLLKAFNKAGYCWISGNSYIEDTYWGNRKEETCYDNTGCYGDIENYTEQGFTILEFEEIEFEDDSYFAKEKRNGEWRECCRLKISSCEDCSTIVAILNAEGYKTHIEDNGGLYSFIKEYYVVVEEKI